MPSGVEVVSVCALFDHNAERLVGDILSLHGKVVGDLHVAAIGGKGRNLPGKGFELGLGAPFADTQRTARRIEAAAELRRPVSQQTT